MRLRLAPVEYKECSQCSEKYEDSKCPKCNTSYDLRQTKKISYDRLILDGVYPSIYEKVYRYRCSEYKCGTLYSTNTCPLCGAHKPQRQTIVWVRTHTIKKSFEALYDKDLLIAENMDSEWRESEVGTELEYEEPEADEANENERKDSEIDTQLETEEPETDAASYDWELLAAENIDKQRRDSEVGTESETGVLQTEEANQ